MRQFLWNQGFSACQMCFLFFCLCFSCLLFFYLWNLIFFFFWVEVSQRNHLSWSLRIGRNLIYLWIWSGTWTGRRILIFSFFFLLSFLKYLFWLKLCLYVDFCLYCLLRNHYSKKGLGIWLKTLII